MALSQDRRLFTVTTPLGADAFALTAFRGREQLSRPFEFVLDLVSDNLAVTAPDLVGKPVGWTVNDPTTAPRQFHGLVRAFQAGPYVGRKLRTYRVEVVPSLWFLTRTADCKIFQAKTVPDILKAVLGQFGVTVDAGGLTATYTAHDYRVQYRETAFAFCSRLMEEEGIFYYFTYTADGHTMVLADGKAAYVDCAPHAEVEYRPEVMASGAVAGWDRRFAFVTGKTAHTDYNFETPATSLLAKTETVVPIADTKKFEVFDYPGRYLTAGPGGGLAKVRMEEIEAGYDTATGAGRCSAFLPAGKFTLKNHPSDTGPFALQLVDHEGTEPWVAGSGSGGTATYGNTFTCFPADVVFRAARETYQPAVYGPQPAIVVGPSGEEIYTDKYGRIKVQFYWDRYGANDENSSCWMRVAEMWAGKGWGMVSTPRIGQEVLVEFLEGDPDQPIVVGRVYNAANMPPYTLPANMTQSGMKSRSSKGGGEADFNELRFEDKKGSEDIYFHAQYDFHRFVEHDDDLKVKNNQTITITKDRTEVVEEGNETITIKQGNRVEEVTQGNETVTIKTGHRLVSVDTGNDTHTIKTGNRVVGIDTGNDTLTVKTGNREVTVETGNDTHTVKTGNRVVNVDTGDDTHTVKTGNRAVNVDTGNDTTTVKTGDITIKASAGQITLDAATKITLKCGGSTIEMTPTAISIKTTKVDIEASGPAAMKGAKVDVEAQTVATVKGSVKAALEGGATAEVKAAIVMIN